MRLKNFVACTLSLMICFCASCVMADSAVPSMTGEYILIEAENMVMASDSRKVSESSKASGGYSVKVKAVDEVSGNSALVASFYVNTPSQYNVWLRAKCAKGSTVVTYRLSDVGEFKEKDCATVSTSYKWFKLGMMNYSDGRQEIYLNSSKDTNFDCIYITSDLSYVPSTKSPAGDANYKSPFYNGEDIPVFPKVGEHPRLYVSKEDILSLKEKLESDFFKSEYNKIKIKGNSEVNCLLPEGATDYTNYSSYNDILLSRAFLYLIGDADTLHAKETIAQTKNFLGTVTFGENNSTYASRYMGDVMVTAACVYDWCYDQMTEMDKQFIIRKLKGFAHETEVGYPAIKRSFVISHAAESLIYRDQLSVGIAIYDEEPGWYNTTASIVFSRLLPAKNFLSASGNDFSGNTYAQARNEGAMHTERMMSSLGYNESVFNPDYEKLYYKFIYGRLPNGVWFKEGDDYAWDRYTPDVRSQLYGELFRYAGSRYGNPYILREGLIDSNWTGGLSSVFDIISTDINVGVGDVTDLPMTHYTVYPMSSMTARTSWQNGMNAPTAMAYVNMREVTVGDHQHRDIGAFQFYYKGMLALDSGLYVYSDHYYNYQIRSVAHNVMLVQDPSETYGAYVNDGGQRLPRNFGSIYEDLSDVEESVAKEECITAKNVCTYTGTDDYRPEFSYISADIAPAYSDKIDGYQRSFAFVNLENEDYPAALFVYDNLKSADASFTKKWLLHSEQEPVVNGNTTIITRTDNMQNGKLVNHTLMPENAKIDIIGGKGNEFSVNGVNYPISASEGVQADMGMWRTETSPQTSSEEDLFLNVMYVSDADRNLPELSVTKGDGSDYVSATIMDKTVVFPKSRDGISDLFEFTLENGEYNSYRCLFTGLSAGKWSIKGNGVSYVLESLEGEGCFGVTLAPGTYTITPASLDSELTEFPKETSVKEDFGDFLIRKNNNLMYLPQPTILIDGKPYVAVDGIFTQLGAQITDLSSDTVTFVANKKTVTLTAGSSQYTVNGKENTLSCVPAVINGRVYVSPADFVSVLGLKSVSYDCYARLLHIKG